MSLTVKIHKKEYQTIIAVCDSSLIGSKIKEGEMLLDLNSDFYRGEECDDEIVGDLIRNAEIIHLIGTNAVNLGIQEGVAEKEQVKTIQGVPYVQIDDTLN